MRKFKKFAAMASAAVLAACAAAPVLSFADDVPTQPAIDPNTGQATEYSITISDHGAVAAKSHTFNAYQIFTGTLNSKGDGFTGGSINWGTAITDEGDALINALKAANFDSDDAKTAIAALKNGYTAYDVALALEKIQSADDSNKLAAVINSVITDDATSAGSYEGDADTAKITLAAAGYYFVKDVTKLPDAGTDALSKFIIRVLGTETIAIKTDAPSLVKKIWHNDTTAAPTIGDGAPTGAWGDVGDNQIGDTVYYYIETTVPDMSAYDTYKYIIRDVMSAGLTYTGVTGIKYVSASGTTDLTEASGVIATNGDDASTEEVETFYVDFGDLKKTLTDLGITPATGDKIYTYYTATLNEDALVSATVNGTQNNPNEAWLTYSNNPNQSGSGDSDNTGNTPKYKVYDWTYTFEAEKVDEKGAPLAGAKFNLKSGDSAISLVEITDLESLKVNGIKELADGTRYFRPAKTGETGGVTEIETTKTANNFMFVGLDDTKTYKLEETEAPANYTKAKDPVALAISNKYNDAGSEVTEISRTVDEKAADKATIENKKGSVLPNTGGIGTKLFYLGGGAMVAVAGVFLITKKRMGKAEK